MANSLSWKERAKLECKNKGLWNLSSSQKREIYMRSFDELKKINIDKKRAEEHLKILRGEESAENLFHRE